MIFHKLSYCLCCGNSDLKSYLNLGNSPPANLFHKNKLDFTKKFPLEVLYCTRCFHSQLSGVLDRKEIFSDYLYVSGTTQTLEHHFWELANTCRNLVFGQDGQKIKVLDIAANDGSLLQAFKDQGCEVRGVDPAKNLLPLSQARGIQVDPVFWDSVTAQDYKGYDIITACNVLAHVPSPFDFLEGCAEALEPDNGIVVVEFPYHKNALLQNQFDQTYHEHISYFNVFSFLRLVDFTALRVFDIKESNVHGGSIQFFMDRIEDKNTSKVYDFVLKEAQSGILDSKFYDNYQSIINENLDALSALINGYALRNYAIVGYGASAKSSVLLNYANDIELDYLVDENPLKIGLYSPGRNFLLKDYKYLAEESRDICFVHTAWNFLSEIRRKIKDLRPNRNDVHLLYVPNTKIMGDLENGR